MMLLWMAYATVVAGVLGVAAWLIDFAMAGRFVARRFLWSAVLFVSAFGPVVFSLTGGISPTAVGNAMDVAATWTKASPIVSDRALAAAWLTASAIFVIWLVASQRRLRRRLVACPSGMIDGQRVLLSSDFGPAVVGVVHPAIVLPAWTLGMPETDRRIIVAHEAEHRQARDPLLAALALLIAVALPWNAALWWQLRRLRLAIEIDCDRRVVSMHGHDPHAYGMLLLATRERASRATPAMALAMAAMRSGLGRRVEALLDGGTQSLLPRLSAIGAAFTLAAQIVSLPAPRLSIVSDDAGRRLASEAPVASSITATPSEPVASSVTATASEPGARQPAAPSGRLAERLRRHQQQGSPSRPRPALTPARVDSSLVRVFVPGPSTELASGRPVSRRARMVVSSTGSTRVLLLPDRGSQAPSPH